MTDWRQIQARIRKARASSDPVAQLNALFEHTKDAMVAFELGRACEKSGAATDAIRWYTFAAERFRRAQWKQKAEEALTRLGAPIPAQPPSATVVETEQGSPLDSIITEVSEEQEIVVAPAPRIPAAETVFEEAETKAPQPAEQQPTPVSEISANRKRKRRGRRGGRGRNKARRAASPTGGSVEMASGAPAAREHVSEPHHAPTPALVSPEVRRSREESVSTGPGEIISALEARVRSIPGDPGLSSRLAKLESQLRRLMACALHSVEEPEMAPAGPGVFLITDTDQTSYYYIESCQTLRVGIGNLLRGGRGSRESVSVKEKLAEHLGISESRVFKYMKDNCAVRWLQLDEGASLLAHFAIAVLHPIANE